jgi:hypothetical protein
MVIIASGTAPPFSSKTTPSLPSHDANVLVVGGGIIGTSIGKSSSSLIVSLERKAIYTFFSHPLSLFTP